MTPEAVITVEKATDVRNLALKKKGFPKESLIKIPGSALYKENSTGATDLMLASDHNNNEAPELGDRVVNLCASGIPFGARGTVVGIHNATTGCVEIVMDEEFVGGTNLQGLCSNFRGKLAVWAHLMKITVENSRDITEKKALHGSGKAKEILSGIGKRVADDNNGLVSVPTPSILNHRKPKLINDEHQITSSPHRHGSRSKNRASSAGKSRAESSGRAKQAGWREAVGPPEKGTGFKEIRKGKSGINQWKEFMKSKKKEKTTARGTPFSTTSANITAEVRSTELKALLGVTPNSASQLKAMLGVNISSVPSAPKIDASQPDNPIASLKDVLGVGAGTNESASHPQLSQAMNVGFPPPVPPSAADQLLQLMRKQQQPLQQMPVVVSGGGSSFNFSYTVEGKDQPEPSSMINSQPPPPIQAMPIGFLPPPVVPVMTQYGYITQPMPVGHPGNPQPLSVQHFTVDRGDENNTGAVADSPASISYKEFPPLGAVAPDSQKVKEESDSACINKTSHAETAHNFIVPSVIKTGKK